MAISDRIAVMNAGVISQIGTPRQLYHRPADLFVATFIGHTNVLKGELYVDGPRRGVRFAGADISLATLSPSVTPQRVNVSLRPEELFVTRAEQGQLHGVVERSVFLGLNTHYRIRLASGERVEIVQESALDDDIDAGDSVSLDVKAEKINVFDETGSASLMDQGGPA